MYNISIGIGGKIFAFNPFDLVVPNQLNDTANCISGLGEAPPPTDSEIYSMHPLYVNIEYNVCSASTFEILLGSAFCTVADFNAVVR
jgi:hypothetical protein